MLTRTDAPLELRSETGELTARFVPGAGMLGCSLRDRDEELLGPGGIPILYPWANRLPEWRYEVAGREVVLDRAAPLYEADDNGLPIHGVLRKRQHWKAMEKGGAALAATLDYDGDLLDAFPFRHRVELAARLSSRELVVTTTVEANGGEAVPVSYGYHPYFRLPGVARADWVVELPERVELELDDRQLPTGEERVRPAERGPLGERIFDHLFRPLQPLARFALSGGGRRVVVEMGAGYPYAQVYAPSTLDVTCFEPMTAPVAALATGRDLTFVRPGERRAATFAVRVRNA